MTLDPHLAPTLSLYFPSQPNLWKTLAFLLLYSLASRALEPVLIGPPTFPQRLILPQGPDASTSLSPSWPLDGEEHCHQRGLV